MANNISVNDIIKGLRSNKFVLGCEMPLGYVPGLPVVQIRGGKVCLLVPYLKYRVTGEVDKTLVYPIRYTVTMVLPEKKMVDFTDLSFQKRYHKVKFNSPVGLFRHEAVKNMTKEEYKKNRQELLGLYGKLIESLLDDAEFAAEDQKKMRQLMQVLTEPSQLPIYQALDEDFYNKYLA